MREREGKSSTTLKVSNNITAKTGKAVVFLQETHCTKKYENLLKYQRCGDMILSHGMSRRRCVCIAF